MSCNLCQKNKKQKNIRYGAFQTYVHITQPTLMPEDTIVKALNDLTNALKQKRNNKGIVEYGALQRIDEILNNIPATEH